MILYALGVITGLLIDIYRSPIARNIRQIESKVKRKGYINEPSDEADQLKEWVNELPNE